jgi:HEAT repeat protein
LPSDLSKLKLRGGKLIVDQKPTEADALLGMLDESNSAALDELLDNPAALAVTSVDPADARRLQQVAKSGPAAARLLAVRALAKLRSVDYAPTLIFALTDPDKRVVREARDGLRSISRNFEGYGPPDNFEAAEQQAAVTRWKEWYQRVRPDAPPLP